MRREDILDWGCRHNWAFLAVEGEPIPCGEMSWLLYLSQATPEQMQRVCDRIGKWDRRVGQEQERKDREHEPYVELAICQYERESSKAGEHP